MLPHKESTSQQAPSATPSSQGQPNVGSSQGPELTAGLLQPADRHEAEDKENAAPQGDSARAPLAPDSDKENAPVSSSAGEVQDAPAEGPADKENMAPLPPAADPVDKENAPPDKGAQAMEMDTNQATVSPVVGVGAPAQGAERRSGAESAEASGPQVVGGHGLSLSPLEGEDSDEISPLSAAAQRDNTNATFDFGKVSYWL